jgi:hypothetical protein
MDIAGLIVAVIAAAVTFTLARKLNSRASERREEMKQVAEQDYHQRVGP